jgi:ATP-binding cassette, subfamily A (ABC1), member 3
MTTFTLNLLFPIGNVFRALIIGLNVYIVACRNDALISYPGSIYAYGGPIFYLCLQVLFLFSLLMWLDRGTRISAFGTLQRARVLADSEKMARNTSVEEEAARVELGKADSDLLRVLHVTKAFGNDIVVDDVSLGLGDGEVLALLGPNGAGKTTLLNIIRGELRPNSGTVYVNGIDVHTHLRSAQAFLSGKCFLFYHFCCLLLWPHQRRL